MKRGLTSTVTAAVAAAIVTCSPVASAKPVDPGNDGSLTPVGLVVDGDQHVLSADRIDDLGAARGQ